MEGGWLRENRKAEMHPQHIDGSVSSKGAGQTQTDHADI